MNFHVLKPWLLILAAFLATSVNADEIVVSGTEGHSGVTLGDFDCSGCTDEVSNSFALLVDASTGSTTAGELWQFFQRQGIKSVDHLTICVDVGPEMPQGPLSFRDIQLMIESPEGDILTNAAMGDHSLVVPAYEVSPFKPEAQLKVALGYDFMQRFSANSTEKVYLNYSSLGETSSTPGFAVQAGASLFQPRFSPPLLFGFVLFWVMVFVLLNRITKPGQGANEPDKTRGPMAPSHPNGQALSV